MDLINRVLSNKPVLFKSQNAITQTDVTKIKDLCRDICKKTKRKEVFCELLNLPDLKVKTITDNMKLLKDHFIEIGKM